MFDRPVVVIIRLTHGTELGICLAIRLSATSWQVGKPGAWTWMMSWSWYILVQTRGWSKLGRQKKWPICPLCSIVKANTSGDRSWGHNETETYKLSGNNDAKYKYRHSVVKSSCYSCNHNRQPSTFGTRLRLFFAKGEGHVELHGLALLHCLRMLRTGQAGALPVTLKEPQKLVQLFQCHCKCKKLPVDIQ